MSKEHSSGKKRKRKNANGNDYDESFKSNSLFINEPPPIVQSNGDINPNETEKTIQELFDVSPIPNEQIEERRMTKCWGVRNKK